MPDYYASQRIIHQKSCIETPQPNSVIESKHQHILNAARALRFQAQLPLTHQPSLDPQLIQNTDPWPIFVVNLLGEISVTGFFDCSS